MGRSSCKRVFAVAGLYHGAGATMFCINFAVFLSKNYTGKIRVIELNESGDFRKLLKALEEQRDIRVDKGSFEMGVISFSSVFSERELVNTMNEGYDFVILDLGCKYLKYQKVFLESDQKIVLGSTLPWRKYEYEHFLSSVRKIERYDTWEYVDMSGGKGNVRFVDGGKIKLKRFDWIAEISNVTECAARVYWSLL